MNIKILIFSLLIMLPLAAKCQLLVNGGERKLLLTESSFDSLTLLRVAAGVAVPATGDDSETGYTCIAITGGGVDTVQVVYPPCSITCAAWDYTPGALLYLQAGGSGGFVAAPPEDVSDVQVVGIAVDSNTVSFFPQWKIRAAGGDASVSTNGSGVFTISHGLADAPRLYSLTPVGAIFGIVVDSVSSTTISCRAINLATGAVIPSTSFTVNWTAQQ